MHAFHALVKILSAFPFKKKNKKKPTTFQEFITQLKKFCSGLELGASSQNSLQTLLCLTRHEDEPIEPSLNCRTKQQDSVLKRYACDRNECCPGARAVQTSRAPVVTQTQNRPNWCIINTSMSPASPNSPVRAADPKHSLRPIPCYCHIL